MQLQNFILYVHLIALATGVVGAVSAEYMRYTWMRGELQLLNTQKAEQLHAVITYSLGFLIMTGIWLFWLMRTTVRIEPYSLIELGLVSLLVLHLIATERLLPTTFQISFSQVTTSHKLLFFLNTVICLISWFGTIILTCLIFGGLF